MPERDCVAKGCCHSPAPAFQGDAPLRLPSCFQPNGGASTYEADGKGKLKQASG